MLHMNVLSVVRSAECLTDEAKSWLGTISRRFLKSSNADSINVQRVHGGTSNFLFLLSWMTNGDEHQVYVRFRRGNWD